MFWVKKRPQFFSRLRNFHKDPYLCGMIRRFNIWHEWIFGPSFSRVRIDPNELATLKKLSRKGTLVYVMKNRGQLEYSFFNHRFLKEQIPLARFANGCRTLYWRPLKDFIKALLARLDYYYEKGLLEDPIQSSYLEDLVAGGESALLNLKVSHEFLFGSSEDPLEFIPPLLRAAQKSQRPVYLVTQQFLYDRHPEKVEKSWVDLLFGEKTNPGMFRKLVMFVMSYRKKASVKFGEALDLKKFIEEHEGSDFKDLASDLKKILLNRLSIERKSITGPALLPRDKLLEKILRNRTFKEDLSRLSEELGQPRKDLEKEVTKYFMEIAASVQYSTIDFFDHLIRWMTNHVFDGLDIDTKGLSKIKAIAGRHPVVLVPSHKSHIDYLLLSYLFYNYDLTLPHVCAGINLKFWPAGHFIRRGGGFFIRRSFDGNKVYKLILEYYLKTLVHDGYSIEFFIEGTRSRTGKLLKPKMGILSMLMKAYLDKAAPDIYFVPLSINYEKILEEKSYVQEAQGSQKEKENVKGLLKVRKKFRKKHGKVFIRFADPLSLKEFFDTKGIKPQMQSMESCRKHVEDFAYRLTYNINRVSVVTPSALVAAAILSYPKKGIPQEQVLNRVATLKHYLDFKGASFSSLIQQREKWAYVETIQKFEEERTIHSHEDFKEKFYTIDETKRPLLDYNKNNMIHFFVSLVCFSKILQTSHGSSLPMGEIEKKYEAFKILLKHDFTFSERATLREHLMRVLDFYVQEGLIDYEQEKDQVYFESCLLNPNFKLYASLLDNFFETSYLTLLYIKHVSFKNVERKKLEADILERGRLLYLKGDFYYPEALSQFNIRNALAVYKDLGLVRVDDKGYYSRMMDKESVARWEEILLSVLQLEVAADFPQAKIDSPQKSDFNNEQWDVH